MKEIKIAKKCCIISLIKSDNYGANLQGYALYHFIHENFTTIDIVVVDLLRPGQKGYKAVTHVLHKRYRYLLQKLSSFIFELRTFQSSRLRKRRFEEFVSNIQFTKTYHNVLELIEDYPQCDFYITGSDQVWCPNREFDISPYLLSFVKNPATKISYAPSISTKILTAEQEAVFIKTLKDFKYISVREISDKNLLNNLMPQKEISVVVDPVLLLPSDFWLKMCVSVNKSNYVLFYSIGPDNQLLKCAKSYCSNHNLELIYFRPQTNRTLFSLAYYSVNDAGPKELLSWIKFASLVITNSYHGVLMSLLLRTPFFYNIAAYSSRFETISSLFALNKHQILNYEQNLYYNDALVDDETITLMERMKQESIRYLMSAIHSCL